MGKENIIGPTSERTNDRKIIGWSREQLEAFFVTESGKELLAKAREKNQNSYKNYQITRDYETINKLFYVPVSRPDHQYWTFKDGVHRTPLINFTKLLFVKSENNTLNLQEQKDFFKNNITPLWKYVYGNEVGVKFNDLSGIYLSKEEYINTAYLLENVFKDDNLNPAKVGIIKKLSDSDSFQVKNIFI